MDHLSLPHHFFVCLCTINNAFDSEADDISSDLPEPSGLTRTPVVLPCTNAMPRVPVKAAVAAA